METRVIENLKVTENLNVTGNLNVHGTLTSTNKKTVIVEQYQLSTIEEFTTLIQKTEHQINTLTKRIDTLEEQLRRVLNLDLELED